MRESPFRLSPWASGLSPLQARQRRRLLFVVGLVAWLAVSAWLAWSVYVGVRRGTADQAAALQATLASQAAQSISDHIAHLEKDVRFLAMDEEVITLSGAGKQRLQRYDEAGEGEFQSVTRMGRDGTIMYTWPNTASIGSNISSQDHVQRLLATHGTVLSGVFSSVQGYKSVALHVPVFRNGAFDGSVAVLIPVDWIAARFVSGIHVGGEGYAWVVSREGVEIACANPTHVGTSIFEREEPGSGERTLALAMTSGAGGRTVLSRDHAGGRPGGVQIVYMRIPLPDNLWSIAVAAPEDIVIAMMSSFLQPWLVAISLVVVGIGALLVLFFRLAVRGERHIAREEAEARYQSIVERLPVVNYVTEIGPPRRTVYISPQVERMFGFTQEQWLADPDMWRRRIHPDDRQRIDEELRQSGPIDEPPELEYRALTADGSVRWIHNRSTVVREAGMATLNGLMIDVTERRHAEEELREREEQLMQSRRLEAVGRLAGGVSHDFNNLLTVINGYADILQNAPDLSTALRADAREIGLAGRRAQALIDQLLAYSRKQAHSPQVLDLNAQIAQMESMLRRLIGEHIALEVFTAADLGLIRMDPVKLQQVIMNLAVNARDAMGEGGVLRIATSNLLVSGADPRRPGLAAGEWVILDVKDTGQGMDQETLSHIFEPFFTTKEKGKGTGLGLSTVYGIVTQSGGTVLARSAPGEGATFEIVLPRASDQTMSSAEDGSGGSPGGAPVREAVPAARAAPACRVLLAEDEDLVRQLTKSILASAGYEVRDAPNGNEALAIHASSSQAFDLLITDVIMPGMGGAELAKRLTAQNPRLKVIYISGYAGEALGTQGQLAEGTHLVQKPFGSAELLAAISRVRIENGQ